MILRTRLFRKFRTVSGVCRGICHPEKIQKYIARCGLESRRKAKELVREGNVRMNGMVCTDVNQCVELGDHVVVRYFEKKVNISPSVMGENLEPQLYAMRKPRGMLCTNSDPKGRPATIDILRSLGCNHLINVGRLDFNSEGLLLYTNDGYLSEYLESPKSDIEREYLIRAKGNIIEKDIKRLERGSRVHGIHYGPVKIDIAREQVGRSSTWLRMILKEGKNREIRNLLNQMGLQVSVLKRIRYGKVTLPKTLTNKSMKKVPIPVEYFPHANIYYATRGDTPYKV